MSGITIRIEPGLTQATSKAYATGSLRHVITDQEIAVFGVHEGDLKRKIGAYTGREPSYAFVKSPTPFNDLYKRYGWEQVESVITPIETRILPFNTVPTVLNRQVFKNQSNKKATVNGKISEQVSNTVSTSWSNNNTLTFNQEISYDLKFMGAGVGGKTSFGFQGQWGKSDTKSQTTTVGMETGVSVELGPCEEVAAELSANSGKMKVEVTYEIKLTGLTAVVYEPDFKGKQVYANGISTILGDSNSVKITEIIEIGYYSEANVIIKNLAGKTLRCERACCF